MWFPQAILKQCEQLSRAGYNPEFSQGMRVARGYADLGYEEFVLIKSRTLLSLFNGKTSEMPEGHEKFFFHIPSADELVIEIRKRGWDLVASEFYEQRTWKITAACGGDSLIGEGKSFYEAILQLYAKINSRH
jgi:hypothetical protein